MPSKVALIAEGGGQRGIFTAGVLDAWLDENYDEFDLFIGTSAGSQNLTSFLARQKGYAKRLIRGVSRNKRFFKLSRALVGKHIVDLDWYFEKTKESNRVLDFHLAQKNLGARQLLITTTNSRDRAPYFLSPTGDDNQWRNLLKASSALPFLYRQGVELTAASNGKKAPEECSHCEKDELLPKSDFYLDGGLAAPLPVTEAYKRGARKIVVIRTAAAEFQAQSAVLAKIKALLCLSGYCPKTIDYLLQHEKAYQQELAFMADPPDDVDIIQIFPGEKLHSKLLGSTDRDLRHDYKVGHKAGKAFLVQQNVPLQFVEDQACLAANDNDG
jgi:predicted patatin/cPLA2 family phospholipase